MQVGGSEEAAVSAIKGKGAAAGQHTEVRQSGNPGRPGGAAATLRQKANRGVRQIAEPVQRA